MLENKGDSLGIGISGSLEGVLSKPNIIVDWNKTFDFTPPQVTTRERERKKAEKKGREQTCQETTLEEEQLRGRRPENCKHAVPQSTHHLVGSRTHPAPATCQHSFATHLMAQRYSVCICPCLKYGWILFSWPWKMFVTNLPKTFTFQSPYL